MPIYCGLGAGIPKAGREIDQIQQPDALLDLPVLLPVMTGVRWQDNAGKGDGLAIPTSEIEAGAARAGPGRPAQITLRLPFI